MPIRSIVSRSATIFCIIGALGFCIDGGLLTLLTQVFGKNVYVSRLFSFTAATFVTWLLNRKYAFKVAATSGKRRQKEYLSYLVVQIGGGLLNLGVFSLLIAVYPQLSRIPIIPLAVGAIAGLIFNYSGSRFWVFAAPSQ